MDKVVRYELPSKTFTRGLCLCVRGGGTCGDLLYQLSGVVAALHQQVGPGGEVPGGVHPEHVGLHPLLGARAQAK